MGRTKMMGWTEEETLDLLSLVPSKTRSGMWKQVSADMEKLGYKWNPEQCRTRYRRIKKVGFRRCFEAEPTRSSRCATRVGQWTRPEDTLLKEYVALNGPTNWGDAARKVGTGRNAKQCRERWVNQLDPSIRPTSSWTEEEDERVMALFDAYPQRWTKIADYMPGRSPNQVKNRHKILCGRRRRQCEDPLDITTFPTTEEEDHMLIEDPLELLDPLWEPTVFIG